MECPRCATQLQERSNYCPQCGFVLAVVNYDSDAQTGGRVPRCRSCGWPVRPGTYPQRANGWNNLVPWNADWGGACEQCGFQFSMTHHWPTFQDLPVHGRGEGRRKVVARPGTRSHFEQRDDLRHLAGIEISVESRGEGHPPGREECFLTKEEPAWLVRALQGALAITFEQYHWAEDTT